VWLHAAVIFLFGASSLLADDSAPVLTEEVVVSATRTEERVGHVPAAPTVLTREQIEKTPFRDGTVVDDLLRYVPGVQPSNLSSRYNHPTAQAVTLRGLGSRRALVLLDGVPLNDGFGGWINWGLIPDTIQRVEVVPGGGSNLYGTWAMGGVIHVLTDRPGAGLEARSETRAGNLGTHSQAVIGRYGTERSGLSLAYRWFHTDGFIPVPPAQRGPVDRTDDSRHEQFTGTLTHALTTSTTLTLSGGLFREDRTFGTTLSSASRTIGTASAGLEGETRPGDLWEAKVFGQWQTFRNLTSRITPSPTVRLGELRERIQTIPSNDFGGLFQWAGEVSPHHRLVVGTDVRAIIGQSEDQLFTLTGMPNGRSLARGTQVGWGIFGEWLATPTDRLTVAPSVRWDRWSNFDGLIEPGPGLPAQTPRDNVASVVNPKLALQYRVSEQLRAGASIYQAFRAPTLNELYRGFEFSGFGFLPNETLSPERLTGGEVRLETDLLSGRRLTLRFTGHYDEVKDQILFVTLGPLAAQRRNVGRTRALGGEVDIAWQAADWFSLKAGYAYVDSSITSFPADSAREGKRVPFVSRQQVVMAVTLGRPEWVELTVSGRYLSRQYADDLNTQPIADFVVLDASLQKRIGKAVRLYVDAENVTDRQYIATQTGPTHTLGAPLLILGGLRLDY
jgi:iron complex outermembrane receptor protein